jgi:hypothetical protein
VIFAGEKKSPKTKMDGWPATRHTTHPPLCLTIFLLLGMITNYWEFMLQIQEAAQKRSLKSSQLIRRHASVSSMHFAPSICGYQVWQ